MGALSEWAAKRFPKCLLGSAPRVVNKGQIDSGDIVEPNTN